jgi:hypothetical protein
VTIVGVEVHECRNGYTPAFALPEGPGVQHEQVFLERLDGDWTVLTTGSGINCTNDPPEWLAEPERLLRACVALGLRPAA